MRKPNAILHMTGYGLVYGLLLAMLYMWSIFLLTSLGGSGGLGAALSLIPGTAYFALLFGGIPGTIMGFIEGWILWYLTRDIQLPMTETEMVSHRSKALTAMGGLTFVGMGATLMLLFGGIFFLMVIPPFVAAAAAMYAVHRYFLKLRAWGSVGKVKNKAKYGLTNQLAYEDTTDDDSVVADEADKQIENQRR